MTETLSRESNIVAHALKCGFDGAGIASARLPPEFASSLKQYIELGFNGDMDWLERRQNERASPDALWPDAKSVIILGMNYGPDTDPMAKLEHRQSGVVSVYAHNKDYHDLVKKRLKQLARWIVSEHGGDVKVFVDTAPVMEKPLAQLAGLGWQGKHTNLVSRQFGSWLFLGAIFSTLKLSANSRETDHCGTCSRCLEICPTAAFPSPYQLDARRCISYLTIEHKGPIPRELRSAMGNRIYGCDDCLAVCPWNKFASKAKHAALHPREALQAPLLASLVKLDDKSFRDLFSGSPIKRTGRDRFIRNVLIAIGNSDDESLADCAKERLDDHSPLVRGAAIWALSRLLEPQTFEELLKENAPAERDESVISEWTAAQSESQISTVS